MLGAAGCPCSNFDDGETLGKSDVGLSYDCGDDSSGTKRVCNGDTVAACCVCGMLLVDTNVEDEEYGIGVSSFASMVLRDMDVEGIVKSVWLEVGM
jgi:hypothetical protein